MKPLLAHIYEPHRVTYPCYVQPKLNGIRALYQNGSFQSRDELPFPRRLLAHLSGPLMEIFSPDVILDGELYVHGWLLQRINAAVTPVRQHPTEDTLKVEYHVFDVVDFGKSFHERLKIAYALTQTMHYVPTWQVHSQKEADEYYASFVSDGYEGMMYRLGDCPYTGPKQPIQPSLGDKRLKFLSDKSNRCWHLLKRKDWQDDEFEIVSLVEGEGKYSSTLGAIQFRNKDGTDLFTATGERPSVGSGLTDADRDHYWANPPIGKLVKVKYLCLSSDGIPLNPTILAIL